jgi:putative toxin-antitoxin system antitoxin component (TIGR02293 family)
MNTNSSLFQRIEDTLGLAHVVSDLDLFRQVESRLPVYMLERLINYGLTFDEVYRLVIPRRTLAHRRQKGEKLSEDESDRVMRIARVLALAENIFGDQAKALCWLRKPKQRLDGRCPLDLLHIGTGGRTVEEMLIQIEYGVFA